MLSETVLKSIRGALFVRKGTLPEGTDMLHGTNQALAVIDSLLSGYTIADMWDVTDIYSRCSDYDEPTISEDQAKAVLKRVMDNFDASIGINWDVIDATLQDVVAGL